MLHQYATLHVDIPAVKQNMYKSTFHKVVKNNLLEQVQIKHEKIENICSTNKIAFTICGIKIKTA